MKLFLFPFAGGSKQAYKTMLSHIPSAIEPVALDISGRGSRRNEPLLTDIHEISEDLYCQIRGQLAVPYVFFGHSMGSLSAYLVIRKIRKANLPLPLLLFVSAFPAPSVLERCNRNLHLLPKDQFLSKAKEYSSDMPKEYQKNVLFLLLEPILRADFQAVETYKYAKVAPLDIPIAVVYGSEDTIDHNEVAPWQLETNLKVRIYKTDGNHFYILDNPAAIVELLQQEIRKRLQSVNMHE